MRCPECGSLDIDWLPGPPDDQPWLVCDNGHTWLKKHRASQPPVRHERHPSGGPSLVIFDHDDPGYTAWVREWPLGWIINTYRRATADYVVLHRAYCRAITQLDSEATTWTAGEFVKVCSTSRTLVTQWAIEATGVMPSTGCQCMA